jgi:uncharacterized protein involved in exopolysaccharide biosynthesis
LRGIEMTNGNAGLSWPERRPLPTTRDIAAVVFRQRWTILAIFTIVLVGALVSGYLAKKYEAHMKILVLRQRIDEAVSAEPNVQTQVSPDISLEDLNSEVELLRSDDVLRKVVIANNLQSRAGSHFGHVDEERSIAAAVRKLGGDLNIELIPKTDVISVSYRSGDPRLAAEVLKSVAASYLDKHRELHRPSGEFRFFDQQTEQYARGLKSSQDQLAAFTEKYGVASANLERDLTLQHLADFDATAHQAQTSVAQTTQQIQSLQAQIAAMQPRITTEIKDSENQSLMEQLKTTLLNLKLKRTELLTKFAPSYRLVQEVDRQIADTTAAIKTEESRPAKDETTDVDPTFVMLRSELAKAQEELNGYKAQAAATTKVAGGYRLAAERLEQEGLQQEDLQRTAKIDEDDYLLYSRKREEARISDALDQRGILNVAVAEQPVVPALAAQSPVKTSGLTLLFGFFVSFGAAFIADYASPSFRTPDEVAGYLDMPVLASLPKPTNRR